MNQEVVSSARQLHSVSFSVSRVSSSFGHISRKSVPCSRLFSPSSGTLLVAQGKLRVHRTVFGGNQLGLFDGARVPNGCLLLRNVSRSFKCGAEALGGASSGKVETEKPEELLTAKEPVKKDFALVSGSAIVIVEAPVMLKTAEPMPMMRPNRGLLKPGDAGRIIDRRPKNVWAIRFAVGAYLIDRKYFEPIQG